MRGLKIKKQVGRPDTPLADTPPIPDYNNMKTTKRSFFKDKDYIPTAIDSAYYKQGFNLSVEGKSPADVGYDMKTTQGLRGYQEAINRGLNPRKKKK